jgi:5'-phosphate synthase pdxT subunit
MDRPDEPTDTYAPRIGVVAMQGAVAEHGRMLEEAGAEAFEVRTLAELDRAEGIVLPGGESTAIRKALDRCGLLEPLRERIAAGLPAFGTCAGMIVLADTEPDGAPPCFGLLDVTVARNGFGSQVHSFEADVAFGEATLHGVFIRAPRIEHVGADVEVLGRLADDEPVVVAQDNLLAATFHPELTNDTSLHERFVVQVVVARAAEPAAHG